MAEYALNWHSIGFVGAALVSLWVVFKVSKYQNSLEATNLTLLMVANSIFSAGYALELSTPLLSHKCLWAQFEYLGVATIPLFVLFLSLRFSGYGARVSLLAKILISVIPVISIILALTNDMHGWMYSSNKLLIINNFPLRVSEKGPWYWVQTAFLNVSVLVSYILFVVSYFQRRGIYRTQALFVIFGATVPWVGHIIFLLGKSPLNIDYSPILIAISGIYYFWGIFKYRVFVIKPLAYERIFAELNDPVLVFDAQNRLIDYNACTQEVFPKAELKEMKNLGLGYFSTQEQFKDINQHLKRAKIYSLQVVLYDEHYILDVKNLYDGAIFIGKILNFKNITWIKNHEAQLLSQQEELRLLNETKDRFFSIISHDLRGPVSTISALTELMYDQFEGFPPDRLHELLGQIRDVSSNTYRLLENLLQWSRLQSNNLSFNPTEIDITQITTDIFNLLNLSASSKQIELAWQIPPQTKIYADTDMLNCILRNLVGNAIKFSNNKQRVELRVVKLPDGFEIQVRDEGVGISEEMAENLLLSTNNISTNGTSNEKGSGLGFIISKQMAERHGGSIQIQKNQPEGTIVKVFLPHKP